MGWASPCSPATTLATQVGIGDIRAELRSEDKAAAIAELGAKGSVAMIRDGINDAPALPTFISVRRVAGAGCS